MVADPITLTAWQPSTKTGLVLQAAPYTQSEPDQLMVHNHALAINPVDWMTQPKRL